MELLYHPMEYKTKMCEKGSHPLQDFCPHAHTDKEIRDVSGYQALCDIPNKTRKVEEEEDSKIPEQNSPPRDSVAELPVKLQTSGKIKKSVSMNYYGPGGMEVALQTPVKKSKNKRRKGKGKGKGTVDGRNTDAILFLDLKLFKVKQCNAGSNHNPKKCLNYHDYKRDRRRPLGSYSSEGCVNMAQNGECPYGDQ